MQHEVVEVLFTGTWKIVLKDREFGPYSTEAEAVRTAKIWAKNARNQGHTVSLVIRGGLPPHVETMLWRSRLSPEG
jgi:hypothetical protein